MSTAPQVHPFNRMRRVFPVVQNNRRNTGSYLPFKLNFDDYDGEFGFLRVVVNNPDGSEPSVPEFLSQVHDSLLNGDLYMDLEYRFEEANKLGVCLLVTEIEHEVGNVYTFKLDGLSEDSVMAECTIYGIGSGMTSPFYVKAVLSDDVLVEVDFYSYGGDMVFPYYMSNGSTTPCQLSVFGSDQVAASVAANDGHKFYMLW